MVYMVAAGLVWLALFALLQWAMRYDAEHATAFAHPIDSVRTFNDAVTESLERQSDRQAG